jgi:hypothetical protein
MATQTARMQYLNLDGADVLQNINPGSQISYGVTAQGGIQVLPSVLPTALSATVIPVHVAAYYVITKTSAFLGTLAAPTTGADDGQFITIMSSTGYAHSITTSNLLQTGTSTVASITFPAYAGASVTLMAYQGKWIVVSIGFGTYVLA